MRAFKLFSLAFFLFTGACAVVSAAMDVAATAGASAVKTGAGDVAAAPFDGDENGAAEARHGHDDDDPRPYDPSRDAMADVDAALIRAAASRRNVLLVLGGNWCHDSRGLAAAFERPELARVIAQGYELVFVDVGYRDRNLDVARRFGVNDLLGTPTVLILSPEGVLLNGDSVHDWRTADSKPYAETLRYFTAYAPTRP